VTGMYVALLVCELVTVVGGEVESWDGGDVGECLLFWVFLVEVRGLRRGPMDSKRCM
jgi:hypothetical protein